MTTAIIVHRGAGVWELRGNRIISTVAACGNAAAAGHVAFHFCSVMMNDAQGKVENDMELKEQRS